MKILEYSHSEDNRIDILQDKLLHIIHDYRELCKFIICGHFNARTRNDPDFIADDSSDYLPLNDDYKSDHFISRHHLCDTISNNYGRILLQVCKLLSVHIVT